MTSLARKYDESKLSARLGILVGLEDQSQEVSGSVGEPAS
jgi:hypothetical protein